MAIAAKLQEPIPPYVDTKTPKVGWYSYNFAILLASFLMIAIASAMLEHEIARLTRPDVAFILTPLWLNFTLSTFVILLGLANLTVLIFVFLRRLWLRKWMLATTIIGWMLLAVMVLVLQDIFLPVLLPNFGNG